tara:strand:- start:3634 stop:5454 length:1821 start_codon:yes stop_codon:yes gene_type:complete
MANTNIQHFYDEQIRRFIIQFVRMLSNFQYETGKNSDGLKAFVQVPARYGDPSRQVANIMRQGSENVAMHAPLISCYIKDLGYARERMQDPTFVDKLHVRERKFDTDTGTYKNTMGEGHTIERMMPTPYNLTMGADIITTNTDQKLQILEQILVLFNPALELQSTENYVDWTSLSYAELSDIVFTSRSIPQGTDDQLDIASLTFTMPIWLNPPAKIKKLGVVEKIIASLYDDDASEIDIDGLIGGQLLSRQKITPGNYGILVLNGQVQLLGSNLVSEIDEFSGGDSVSGADSTHTHASQEKAIDVPSKFGPNISWNKLVSQFGYIRDGISQLKLLASVHTAYGDDVLTEISGTIALSSTDDSVLLFTVDSDTIPTDTLTAVTAIVDPQKSGPGTKGGTDPNAGLAAAANGQRYLITRAIGGNDNIPISNLTISGSTITVTTKETGRLDDSSLARNPHGLTVGDTVTIAGTYPDYYNGKYTVATVPADDIFTVTMTTDGSTARTISNPITPATTIGTLTTIRTINAWGNLVASPNDIIQYDGSNWSVSFDASNFSVGLDSSLDSTMDSTLLQYVTNSTTQIQYKWTGESWVLSYEGEYKPGDWRLVL